MKKIFLITFSLFSVLAYCQETNDKFQEYIKTFEYYFNNDSFEEIFESFSDEMKNDLPKDTAISFFNNLKKTSGKINKIEYDSSKDSFNIYKAYLDKKTYLFFISLDDTSKVDGIYFEQQ
ncbi:DUF3887 domain-containing protein [Empedobacter brevis]|uniref:DUF3887 domain-containing protein n=1 Tax=Empedobacter brevis TaxID=247 RepID=UPI002FDF763D